MENKQRYLLAAAFAAASIGSTTVTAICLCAIIFLKSAESEQALAMEALSLALCEGILSSIFSIITTLLRIVGIAELTSIVSQVVSVITSVVGIAVFIIGIMAAMELMRGKMPKVPFFGGKFNLKAE